MTDKRLEVSKTEGFMVEDIFMEGYETKFKPLFEELFEQRKAFKSLLPDGDLFKYAKCDDFVRDSFFSQLEILSRTHGDDPAFIGEYVVEFFVALVDDQKFSF